MLSVIEVYILFLYFIFYWLSVILVYFKVIWYTFIKVSIKRPVYDNAVSRRSWLCWCVNWRQDWTEIHLYGLQCGLFRIALHLTGRAAMHLVVPSLTEQDCVVVDSTAVSCPWLNGTGRDGTGLSCYGLHFSALHWTSFDCNWLIWTWAMLDQMYLAGRKWIEIRLDGTELAQNPLNVLDRTSVEWSGLDWTEPDSTS